MGRSAARVTGVSLSVVTILLGGTISVLLYFAGQRAIDLFYSGTSTDREGRIHRQNPADDWYGQLLLKGWTAGFIYILAGITGLTSALFYNTCCNVVHLAVLVAMITVSSFLHCGGGMLLILYRVLVIEGATRYQPFLGDCVYSEGVYPYDVHEDLRCLAGRKAMIMGLSALGVMFVAWIFMLSDMLYRGCTFHHIKKKPSMSNTNASTDPPRRRRPPNRPVHMSSRPTSNQQDISQGNDQIDRGKPPTEMNTRRNPRTETSKSTEHQAVDVEEVSMVVPPGPDSVSTRPSGMPGGFYPVQTEPCSVSTEHGLVPTEHGSGPTEPGSVHTEQSTGPTEHSVEPTGLIYQTVQTEQSNLVGDTELVRYDTSVLDSSKL